jgi:hypothetical protein
VFVEQFACLKTVVELADHAVEQVTLGCRVPVPLLASAPVVGIRSGRGPQSGEGPQVAGVDPVDAAPAI